MWKALNGKLSVKKLESITGKVQSANGYVNPAILKSLMDAMLKQYGKIPVSTIKAIVSKSRPQDCSPVIRATEILVSMDETTAAAELLSKNTSRDMFHRYLAEAELYHGEGDRDDSIASAKKALELDPSERRLYTILEEDDPNGPWADMASVQSAVEGKEDREPKDPKLSELYSIYRGWFGFNKDSATDKLINSRYYKEGDWEFILASARMSMDEKDWHSAIMMFNKILETAPPFVLYEAAEAYIAGHNPEEALDLYDALDQTSARSMQGRIVAYAQLGSENDMMNAIYDYLDSEFVGTEGYTSVIDLLISSGSMDQAKAILDRMAVSNRRDPSYLVAYSKYLLERGDVRGANRACREAVYYGKKDPAVRVMAARMKLIAEDVKGSEKECDKILSEYPEDLDAMVLKRDIYVQKNDVKGALEICRQILEIVPDDVDTMITLSGALSSTGDMNSSVMMLRNVLRTEPSRENILTVIGSMIDSGMNREAMFLCYDLEKEIPPDPMIRRLRGNAEYGMGEYIKASVSYAAAAELAPHDPVIWHSKGMADEARGDLESAEESYNRAVLLDLNESEYWISKAVIQEKFEDYHGAIESLNRAIELDPDSIYPMVRKAVILEKSERYEEAMYFVDLCMVSDPQNADVALMGCRILRESGQPQKAYDRAKEVNDVVGSEASALELAACCMALEKRSEAARTIEHALDKAPESLRLKAALESIEGGVYLLDQPEGEIEEKADDTEDAEAAAAIAESMLSVGNYKAALKSADRAISVGGEETRFICLKVRILLEMGEVREAETILEESLKREPKNSLYHEAMGDVRLAKSEFRGALQEYEKAMSYGLAIPEVLVKKGDAQQGLGYYDKSIDSYSMAVNRDPSNNQLRLSLARKLYDRGYMSRAEAQISIILDKQPDNAEAIILLTKIKRDMRKDAGITEAYRMFKICNVKDDALIREMMSILESAGHDEEARNLRRAEPESPDSLRIKRSAERVLRRAYVSRTSPDDEDLLLSLGFEGEALEEIRKYIQKDAPCGDIVPGSPDFQKYERASNDLIMKMGWKDLEAKSRLPLENVFVSGSFKDVDEAKRLVSYISRAMEADVVRDEALKMVLDRVQGTTVYEIMKSCRVGVYQARQIKLLLGVQ